ncbi:hypothetical protein LPA46_18670, partial [Halobacterium sp. KA-6]|nr:hypothetical protein [Halobacterium sp. KA-6]
VTPVLLPGTAFGLGADYADARAFLDAGHEVALATDFNPNCFARSMSFVATLASVGMRMTPHEAIRGVTSAAAGALDRDDGTGTLRLHDCAVHRRGAPQRVSVARSPLHRLDARQRRAGRPREHERAERPQRPHGR